jgi:DNA-binding CsgD family transcriptional regulator
MSDDSESSRVADPDPLDLKHDRVLLSNQEAEVVRRTQTKSYATVAEELGISQSTVGTYRNRATDKLDEQVKVARRMLRQQQADQREENIVAIAREAVECLRGCGFEVEFGINIDRGNAEE